ncbi:MAG: hypothetical protein AAFO07_10695 [Bacteroidota bacterium]
MRTLLLLLICTVFSVSNTYAQAQPPCNTEAHAQFDFWVGEWNVFDSKADTIVGTNTITRTLNGCVIEENWTGSTGFRGKSFNTFSPLDSTWNQVWVDQGGSTFQFKGKYEDQTMKLKGQYGQAPNQILFDLSFHWNKEEDTVRQVWKSSSDKGENWQTVFDGTYKRKK